MIRRPTSLRRVRAERGQVIGYTAVMIVAMIAMGAFVMDVGSWLRTHRSAQATADAAALAGAQALPKDATQASALALGYAAKNGGGVVAGDVKFTSNRFTNDTISVTARRTSPGFLSRVLGVNTVQISADAKARAFNLGSAKYVGPFAVRESHPFIRGNSNCPCLGDSYVTTIDLDTGIPSLGAFKIINVDGSRGGISPSTLNDWILQGLNGYMGLGWYYSNPGAKYNPDQIEDAVTARIGSEILVPVYSAVREQGAGYEYNVIGWIGFHILGFTKRGNTGALTGYFTSVVWEGVAAESGGGEFFGATVVKLVG